MKIRYQEPEIPRLPAKPCAVDGVASPVVSLDGTWRWRHGDDPDLLVSDTAWQGWETVTVPSFMSQQRRATGNGMRRYVVKREVACQDEWRDKRLFLRFESVNGFASFYIDGEQIGVHQNGFLAFGFDITEHVCGKERFTLAVAVEELSDKVSSFSVGGILRSVALYVLPATHITGLRVTTGFDHQFRRAHVGIAYTLSAPVGGVQVTATLIDPMGRTEVEQVIANGGTLAVEHPLRWDAEHPWLYTLRLRVQSRGTVLQEAIQRIGLRQIDRAGNRLYVNGQEVKLRGACRHEISPLDGRCLTPALIEQDVALFKEANCNYIRTSHYPPSEYFLDLCDEKGLYVEDELPLAFIARTLDYTQRDPAQTERYLSAFAELYARDGNHPSVLMWSLCNESFGGYNFDLLNRFAQRTDPTRPTKFSYPMTMREEDAPVDIWSVHYSNLDEDLGSKMDNVSVAGAPGKDMPVLHDEYAHVPCYNREEHRRDPAVRDFWGEGLAKFWTRIWNTEGALGGAIWAGIDETDIYRGGDTRLEWGIIDIWRRRKPEHYGTRKAYSPVVAALLPQDAEGVVAVQVENRFCHTDLNEVHFHWRYGDAKGVLRGPDAPPRATGVVTFPIAARPGEALCLEVADASGDIVDEYRFVPLEAWCKSAKPAIAAPSLTEDARSITVSGEGFALRFSRANCQIEHGDVAGERVFIGGPRLHMPYMRLGRWVPSDMHAETAENAVEVHLYGRYEGTAEVSFRLRILGDGTIETNYTIEKLLRPLPHREKLRVGVDCGGLDELGVAFLLTSGQNTLAWKRRGLYTVYPEDHIARNEGIAHRYTQGSAYGEAPDIAWSEEMRSYILNGKYDVDYRGSNDFRSRKGSVLSASLYKEGARARLTAVSDGAESVRVQVEEPEDKLVHAADSRIVYSGAWHPVEDCRGSLAGMEMWSREAGASAEITFTGTGIVWYGPVDTVGGIARVYLDGKLVDDRINQRVAGVDFPGSAAGYDKKYNYPLYSAQGLAHGEHTLRVEATGEKAADASDAYIVIDHFRIIEKPGEEPVSLLVLNDYNYPHIAWGNPARPPVLVSDGSSGRVTVRLEAQAEKADASHKEVIHEQH